MIIAGTVQGPPGMTTGICMLIVLAMACGTGHAGTGDDFLFAIIDGDMHAVESLIGNGISVDTADRYGKTALMWAVVKERIGIARYLIERGADVNARDGEGTTALMWAVVTGNIEMVRLLVRHEARVEVRDVYGRTAESIAQRRGLHGIAGVLRGERNLP